jgi:hypothetical protein
MLVLLRPRRADCSSCGGEDRPALKPNMFDCWWLGDGGMPALDPAPIGVAEEGRSARAAAALIAALVPMRVVALFVKRGGLCPPPLPPPPPMAAAACMPKDCEGSPGLYHVGLAALNRGDSGMNGEGVELRPSRDQP